MICQGVVEAETSARDENHLLQPIAGSRNHTLHGTVVHGLVLSRVQADHTLVNETTIARSEEVVELFDEITEDLVDDASLHFWRELLVEPKLFNNQVEIFLEGFFNRFTYLLVKGDRHVNWIRVGFRLLHLFDPDVQLGRFLEQKAVEVHLRGHKRCDQGGESSKE